ncbi:MAG TPA: dTDP-glucose 4,6-dehydratase [Candidatus Woesebacteria bacterium]|nr:dTDP-glucose 4,6-dehydratase [Candidatus Woesebacteria bacterium]
MKLLVTGGLGFIGSNFIHYWLRRHPDDFIVNLDKITYAANPANLKDWEGNSHYQFIKGDIGDSAVCRQAMEGVEAIVHFAAESHVDRSLADPELFLQTNVLGTFTLLNVAAEKKIRFHHISTDEVFGALPLDSSQRFNELTVYDPRSPYSASKAASDHLVRAFYHSFGLPITISNCSNNYGPYQSPEKFIPRIITNLLTGQKVPVYGDGLYVRDWLYVEDHCRAIELILMNGRIGETYCVGGMTENINNLTLTKTILEIMGKDENQIEFVADRPGHDRRYAVDWGKIKRELNWEPQYDFKEALKLTVAWYQNNLAWWRTAKEEAEKFYQKIGR